MTTNRDPNAGQPRANNTRQPGASPLPIPPAAPPSSSLADTGETPGLRDRDEQFAALKDSLTPDLRRGTVGGDGEANLQGGPEAMDYYEVPPDGLAKNWPDRGGQHSAIER